jgi:hypothetical protein
MLPLAAPAGADDWPQLQHDAGRTGYTDATVPFDRTRKGGPPVFESAWDWEKPAEISPLVQPVVAAGIAYVGDYDGVVHAISMETGKTLWTCQTGGLIYHTAAVHQGLVFVGCQDGALYAIDAANGQIRWKHQTGRGIVTAPAALGDAVFTASKDGRLYALNAATGRLLWQYPAAGQPPLAPILCSPAAGGGVVSFADESLTAFAIDIATGQLKWRTPLRGQSMMYFWPVLGEKTGVVVYRTQPIQSFHAILGRYDSLLARRAGISRNEHNKLREDRERSRTWAADHRELIRQEQDYLRQVIGENPWDQTCFVLDLNTGKEKYIPPVPYTGGGGYTPAPPVLDDANQRGWMIFRSAYSITDGGYMVRGYTDIGTWDPATGYIRQIDQPKQGWETFHLIGDEMILLSANKDLLFLSTWPNNGAIGIDGHDSYNVTADRKLGGHDRDHLWAANVGSAAGNGGGHGEATIVTAAGRIVWNSARYIRAMKPRQQ